MTTGLHATDQEPAHHELSVNKPTAPRETVQGIEAVGPVPNVPLGPAGKPSRSPSLAFPATNRGLDPCPPWNLSRSARTNVTHNVRPYRQ
jgi:hypothetical protein